MPWRARLPRETAALTRSQPGTPSQRSLPSMVEPHVAHAAPAARYASYEREIVTWMDLFLTSEGLRRCTLYVFIALSLIHI